MSCGALDFQAVLPGQVGQSAAVDEGFEGYFAVGELAVVDPGPGFDQCLQAAVGDVGGERGVYLLGAEEGEDGVAEFVQAFAGAGAMGRASGLSVRQNGYAAWPSGVSVLFRSNISGLSFAPISSST